MGLIYLDLNRFGFDPPMPDSFPPGDVQRGYQPVYDGFPVVQGPDFQNVNDPTGQIPWYEQQASFTPVPSAGGDGVYTGGRGGDGVYTGGINYQQFIPQNQQVSQFDQRFTYGVPQFNYQPPQSTPPMPQPRPPIMDYWLEGQGETDIGDPPRSTTGGRNGNLPTIQGIQQYPQNYNQPFYGQNPTELGQFYGAPHQFDQTAPANSFNTRFNEVFDQPSYMAQEVPSFNGTSNQYVDQGFRDLGMGGPSYDQYTFNPGGDFPPFESPVAEGGMRMMGGDTLPTTIAQPLPPLPGHNATGYYDPRTNATSYPEHIGPGGTPVVAGPSYVPYQSPSVSTFSPISSQSGIYVTASNMPILGLPVY